MKRRTGRLALMMTIAALAIARPAIAQSGQDGLPPKMVHVATGSDQPDPLTLLGYLRRPIGQGPFAAIVLLHGCGGDAKGLDIGLRAKWQRTPDPLMTAE